MERVMERFTDGKSAYLRFSDRGESLSEHLYEIKMINANRPAGLLPMHVAQEDGRLLYDYDITGLKSLKDSEGDEVQVDYLYSLITSMAREAEVLTEFMLAPDKLRLSPEAIFFRQWTGEVFFCYDPGKTESLRTSLNRLMEYFLKKLDPKEEEDVLFMYGLYQRTREPVVTLTSLQEYFLENREKYLKIGEEREKKKEQKDAENSRERTPAETIAENSIYEDLGLEKPERAAAFSFLRKNREPVAAAAAAETGIVLDLDEFRDRSRVADTETGEDPMEMFEEDLRTDRQVPDAASDRRDLDPRAIFGKLRPYGFELAVGGVVLAGILLFVLT